MGPKSTRSKGPGDQGVCCGRITASAMASLVYYDESELAPRWEKCRSAIGVCACVRACVWVCVCMSGVSLVGGRGFGGQVGARLPIVFQGRLDSKQKSRALEGASDVPSFPGFAEHLGGIDAVWPAPASVPIWAGQGRACRARER